MQAGEQTRSHCRWFILSLVSLSAGGEIVLPGNFAGRFVPRWQNGFVSAVLPERHSVEIYDGTGTRKALIVPNVPGASHLIRDVATSRDGTIAISLGAMDAASRAGNLIGWHSSEGKPIRMVSTGGFGARRIAFDGNGILWAAGPEFDANHSPLGSHDVIRRYDREGRLLGSSLNSATLRFDAKSHPTAEAFLAMGEDGAAFISLTAKTAVMLDAGGKEVERRPIPELPSTDSVTGAAVLRGGDLAFSVQGREDSYYVISRRGTSSWVNAGNLGWPAQQVVIGSHAGNAVLYAKGRVKLE